MYTLGGGIDPERGWGHRDETWHAKEELAAYGVQPDWFGLGDRDLATHLVRTQMLRAGYPLSQVTEALCSAGHPVRGCCRSPTTAARPTWSSPTPKTARNGPSRLPGVVGASPRAGALTQLCSSSVEQATAAPGVTEAIADADVVLLAPSNPVVSIGPILQIPGIRGALRSTKAPVIGYSPIIDGKPLRGMADQCLVHHRRRIHLRGRGSTLRVPGRTTGILDGWLVHEGDHAEIEGVRVRAVPLLMTDPATTAEMVRAGLDVAGITL